MELADIAWPDIYSTRRHCCSISAELVSFSYRPALLLDEQFVLELSSCQVRSERTDMATHFLSITAVGRSQLLAGGLELSPRFYQRGPTSNTDCFRRLLRTWVAR